MEVLVNRAELLMASWRSLERELLAFGKGNGTAGREILVQQHRMLCSGLARMGVVLPHERPQVALLRATVARLERAIWPNVVWRFLVRAKQQLWDRPREIGKFKVMRNENLLDLKRWLGERGFGVLLGRLEREMDYQRDWFVLKMAAELDGGRRIGMALEFGRGVAGDYHPVSVAALLEDLEGNKRQHDFSLEEPLDVAMVTNLMLGRAVCVDEDRGLDGGGEKWLQLHFGEGDSYLRHFRADYGYEVGGLLVEVSKALGLAGLDDARLVSELKLGNRVLFDAPGTVQGKFSMEADPSGRQLLLRDVKGNVQSLEVLGEMKVGLEKGLDKCLEVPIAAISPERAVDRSAPQGLGR